MNLGVKMNWFGSNENFILVLHVLLTIVDLILGAPTRLQKETRSGSKYIDMLRRRRSAEMTNVHTNEEAVESFLHDLDDSRLTLVLDSDKALSNEFLNEAPHTFTKRSTSENTNNAFTPQKRSKRHSQNAEATSQDFDVMTSSRHNRRQRKRRSVAWMLSATIELCNTHRHLCKTVSLEEDEVKMTLNFQDM